jgi:hypothetical protein
MGKNESLTNRAEDKRRKANKMVLEYIENKYFVYKSNIFKALTILGKGTVIQYLVTLYRRCYKNVKWETKPLCYKELGTVYLLYVYA